MILTGLLSLTVLGQTLLPGSTISLAKALEQAPLIVVAEPERLRLIVGSGPTSWSTIPKLKVSRILKGKPEARDLRALGISASGHEALPAKEGEQYIYFIKDYKGHPNVLKMLPNTDVALDVVRKEIAARENP